jgi:hypothetical protein
MKAQTKIATRSMRPYCIGRKSPSMRSHGGTCGSSARKLRRVRNRKVKNPPGPGVRTNGSLPCPESRPTALPGGKECQPASQPTAVTALNSPRRATHGGPQNRPYHSRQLAFPRSKRPSGSGRPPATATGDADRSPRCPPPRRAAHVTGVAGPPHVRTPRHAPRGGHTSDVAGVRSASAARRLRSQPCDRPHERVAIRRGRAPATGHRPRARVNRESDCCYPDTPDQ